MQNIFLCAVAKIVTLFTKKFLFISVCSVIFILASSQFLFFPIRAYADTIVTADITSDTVWDASHSPYIISQSLSISPDAKLSILPGVVVKFNHGNLLVKGILDAQGSAEAPISFSSLNDTSIAFDGIVAENGKVYFTNVDYSHTGTISAEGSTLAFSHITSTDMKFGIAVMTATSSLSIASGTFQNISGDSFTASSESTLSFSDISLSNVTNGSAFQVFDKSSAECTRCQFSHIHDEDQGRDAFTIYTESSLKLSDSTVQDAGTNFTLSVFDFTDNPIIHPEIVSGASPTQPLGNTSQNQDASQNIISQGTLAHVTISNTTFDSANDYGLIARGNASLTILNSTIKNYTANGITMINNSSLNISNSILSSNGVGIFLQNNATGTATSNSIINNSSLGIQNKTLSHFAAQNNWWGSTDGPGNAVTSNVDVAPWLDHDPFQKPTCCSNVVFIPGIEGSRLYSKGSLSENQLWEPNRDGDVGKLFLDSSGKSSDPLIYTRDIISKTNYPAFNIDIYQKFSEYMDSLVNNQTISKWQPYPYDWRLSIDDITLNGSLLEDGTHSTIQSVIENLASTSKTKKVTIVAHSYGGLIAKELVSDLEKMHEEGLIDKVILVASPQLGTPVAVPILLHGYDQALAGGLLLKTSTARQLAENSPMTYALLPSESYSTTQPFVQFDSSIDSISNLFSSYGTTITTPNTLYSFITGTVDGRNKPSVEDISIPNIGNGLLLEDAKKTHENIDLLSFPSDINLVEIAGTNKDTLVTTHYLKKSSFTCILTLCSEKDSLDYEPILSKSGDGTVPTESAITNPQASHYYINLGAYNSFSKENRSHADILEISPVEELLGDLIQNTTNQNSKFISQVNTVSSADGIDISIHSPVTLNLYDEEGNHTGPLQNFTDETDMYEAKIPNSYYMPFGEGVYAGVSASTSPTLVLEGTDVGTFTLDIKNSMGTTTYSNIPILPFSKVTTVINDATTSILKIDYDGDGIIDSSISSSSQFNPIEYIQSIQNLIPTFTTDQKTKDKLNKKIAKIIKDIQNGKIKNVQKNITSNILNLEIGHKKYTQKLSSSEKQMLLTFFTTLLDNIEN